MEDAYVLQLHDQHFRDLSLNFCGYGQCRSLHSYGPAVRPCYILHFVLEGKGTYYVEDKPYPLEKGQGFLIEPDVLTFYQADIKDPWKYLWVGFSGDNCARYLQEIGLDHNHLIFQSDRGDELFDIVRDMLKHNTISVSNEMRLQGLLFLFFSILAETTNPVGQTGASRENIYVRKAVEYIQKNYCNPIKVSDIAGYVSLNRSYLSTLFQNHMGMTLQSYISNCRITRAVTLLSITDLSVESIAESCGYKDPLVFSKAFKNVKGITPTGFRRTDREEKRNKLNKMPTRS